MFQNICIRPVPWQKRFVWWKFLVCVLPRASLYFDTCSISSSQQHIEAIWPHHSRFDCLSTAILLVSTHISSQYAPIDLVLLEVHSLHSVQQDTHSIYYAPCISIYILPYNTRLLTACFCLHAIVFFFAVSRFSCFLASASIFFMIFTSFSIHVLTCLQ